MTTAALSYSKFQKKLQVGIAHIELPKVPWNAVCVAGGLLSALLLIFYMYQINTLTKGSYVINNYQDNIATISANNRNLEVSFAESSFLGQSLVKIQTMNFEKTTSVRYIQLLDNSLTLATNEKF